MTRSRSSDGSVMRCQVEVELVVYHNDLIDYSSRVRIRQSAPVALLQFLIPKLRSGFVFGSSAHLSDEPCVVSFLDDDVRVFRVRRVLLTTFFQEHVDFHLERREFLVAYPDHLGVADTITIDDDVRGDTVVIVLQTEKSLFCFHGFARAPHCFAYGCARKYTRARL